jgi:hypothetical protein
LSLLAEQVLHAGAVHVPPPVQSASVTHWSPARDPPVHVLLSHGMSVTLTPQTEQTGMSTNPLPSTSMQSSWIAFWKSMTDLSSAVSLVHDAHPVFVGSKLISAPQFPGSPVGTEPDSLKTSPQPSLSAFTYGPSPQVSSAPKVVGAVVQFPVPSPSRHVMGEALSVTACGSR